MSLVALTNAAANQATKVVVKQPGIFDWFLSVEFQVLVFRLFRLGSVVLIIYFVNLMLLGAFEQMNSSGKDEVVRKGRSMIGTGFLGAVSMIMLFFIATAALAKFGA